MAPCSRRVRYPSPSGRALAAKRPGEGRPATLFTIPALPESPEGEGARPEPATTFPSCLGANVLNSSHPVPGFFLKVTGTEFPESDEQNRTHSSNLAKISPRNVYSEVTARVEVTCVA